LIQGIVLITLGYRYIRIFGIPIDIRNSFNYSDTKDRNIERVITMAFEEFTAKTRSNVAIPMVSILKHGRIGLNHECFTKYFKEYKFVVFLYDKQNKKVGMRPTNAHLSNAFNIKETRNGKLATISATTFLNYYNIPFDKSQSFPCHWNETEKVLELQL